MPLYEYRCEACEKESELLVKGVESRPKCPECGSTRMKKLLSVIGSPVIGDARGGNARESDVRGGGETCGRPQCGSGCMFGN